MNTKSLWYLLVPIIWPFSNCHYFLFKTNLLAENWKKVHVLNFYFASCALIQHSSNGNQIPNYRLSEKSGTLDEIHFYRICSTWFSSAPRHLFRGNIMFLYFWQSIHGSTSVQVTVICNKFCSGQDVINQNAQVTWYFVSNQSFIVAVCQILGFIQLDRCFVNIPTGTSILLI